MKKINHVASAVGFILTLSTISSAIATDTPSNLDVTVNFTEASQNSALRLKSVYSQAGVFNQNNSGGVSSTGTHDQIITTTGGNVQVDVTAIGNNFSSDLVGLKDVYISNSQINSGSVTSTNTVTHPSVGGNLEMSTTAIGNNTSIGWDLTTDLTPGNDSFAQKKDGPIRDFSVIGSFAGAVSQNNAGNISAVTTYRQDPAVNIKVSTTAIGNNLSFGAKTR